MDAASWVGKNTIFQTVAGSHLYGTDRPDSDVDERGVCLDTPESIFGFQGFEQYEHPEVDTVIYSVSKFLKMCLDANPSILDVLFAPGHKWIFYLDSYLNIWNSRHSFLSQKVRHTFSGYAFSQLKRIERHKKWLDNPPRRVCPDDFGLYLYSTPNGGQRLEPIPERYNFVLDRWPYIDTGNVRAAIKRRSLYTSHDRTAMIAAYKQADAEYKKYREWLKNRNQYRAVLEAKFGYDVKHASHLVRLLMKGTEILTTGDYNPVLNDEQLKVFDDVKNGRIEYDALVKWALDKDREIREIQSDLPRSPDIKTYRWLVVKFSAESLKSHDQFMSWIKTGG